jgi:transcriptional regulator with XRE-family HTH domain
MQETTWSDTRIVVKMLCEERKITMRHLADSVGLSRRALNERLDQDPQGKLLGRVAETIGVTAEDITEICRLMKLDPSYVSGPAATNQNGEQ